MDKLLKNIFSFLLLFALLSGLLVLYQAPSEGPEMITLNTLAKSVNEEKVAKITVKENSLEVELKDGTKQETTKARNI